MIVEPHSVSVQSKGCDGVQEAGCQTAETAVSEGWLGLHLFDLAQGFAVGLQDGFYILVDAQIDQIVGEKLSDEKFSGDIVQLLFSGV